MLVPDADAVLTEAVLTDAVLLMLLICRYGRWAVDTHHFIYIPILVMLVASAYVHHQGHLALKEGFAFSLGTRRSF